MKLALGAAMALIAFGGEWSVGFLTKHNEGLILDDWLSV